VSWVGSMWKNCPSMRSLVTFTIDIRSSQQGPPDVLVMTLGVVRGVVAGGFLTTTKNAGGNRSGCDQEPVKANTTQELMKKSVHPPYGGLPLLPKSRRRVDKWPRSKPSGLRRADEELTVIVDDVTERARTLRQGSEKRLRDSRPEVVSRGRLHSL
jgi:hypothetical protein